MKRSRVLIGAGLIAVVWLIVLATQIVEAGNQNSERDADVAIVLGAAAYPKGPSPVFEERIKHGIALYQTGRVRRLLFTGGYGEGAKVAESLVAKRYALEQGVPENAILTETVSRTTRQNLVEANRLLRKHKLKTALVVSDPLHLKRALKMAEDLGMDASSAPTPTSRYRSWQAKGGFLLREVYFYNHYLVTGN